MTYELTPSQTVGPYFGIALTAEESSHLVPEGSPHALILNGVVTDGQQQAVPEGMIEIWQADANGSYDLAPVGDDEGFSGFGRCHTDDQGQYRFVTLKPGPVPASDNAVQAPHVNMTIFGGGLLKPVRTRVYFDDESPANSSDPVLNTVPRRRRDLLVARVEAGVATLDICLQGDNETPFFDV